ncbi:C40 family peptidase [Clostridium faecium]|uniref:C40 family peptidase n=1 Tax=Clostridium faecium TaxID=2762223 RepID=A0ABR8YNN7_9CLOT|nr:NlpC/P60 family protein [Clostridium faecium]MBD8045801.1 C40 family peptidase [Clostridium faecium]
MDKEKELIKKIIKGLTLLNLAFIIMFIVFVGSIGIILSQDNGNGYITDIGALGVPTEFVPHFNEASRVFNIPNWVLAAVAKQESNFNPNTSYEGAYGIMQIQKIDPGSEIDLWRYLIDNGLGKIYKNAGYSFSSSEEMWRIFLKDPKAQIFAGAYEIRYYANYVLWRKNYIKDLDYNSNKNMTLINWKAKENDSKFKDLLRRIFACYNGGPSYGMNVDLDNAQFNYPNKVFQYAMEFRKSGLAAGDNKTIEKAIEAGMKWVGKSPYVWGGGRTEEDIKAGRFDCSSFVHYCYAQAGISLGDYSGVTTFTLINIGEKIKPKDMKRGDIIFFDTYTTNGHVGIYLGDGKVLNDNSSLGVWIDDLNDPYWKEVFNGEVRRIIKSK